MPSFLVVLQIVVALHTIQIVALSVVGHRMAKGAGIHLGLSFIVKDIKCGWLSTAGFEGSRVKYLEHKILFQLSRIEQCCNQLHSIS